VARKPADQSVNKEDIIRAAADVLRENGYDATTMKDIAARVNLTAASLYHHFRNKDLLLISVLEIGLDHAINMIEPLIESDLSSSEKLRQMICTHIVEVTRNPAVGAAMVFEIRALMNVKIPARADSDDKLRDFVERRDAFFARRDYFEKIFRQVVKDGVANGEFKTDDPAIVTKAMLGANNWVGVWYKGGGRLTGEQIADVMSDTFIIALQSETRTMPTS